MSWKVAAMLSVAPIVGPFCAAARLVLNNCTTFVYALFISLKSTDVRMMSVIYEM